jgi:hypothetical protein
VNFFLQRHWDILEVRAMHGLFESCMCVRMRSGARVGACRSVQGHAGLGACRIRRVQD